MICTKKIVSNFGGAVHKGRLFLFGKTLKSPTHVTI